MVVHAFPYKILSCGMSDIGLVRQNNEDVWAKMPALRFFALADGMGGHQAGEVAAKEAVGALIAIVEKKLKSRPSLLETQAIIQRAIEQVNSLVYKMGRSDNDLQGMGTTLCCIYFYERGIVYGHVGDSRVYRQRAKKLHQLTKDHSLLSELIDLGQLSEKQASEFLYKNIITRAIGTEPKVEPSVQTDDVAPDDIYLMCTDGLSDLLSLEEIEKIINRTPSLQECAKKLIQAAKDEGGYDNITVVLIKVQEIHETKDLSR